MTKSADLGLTAHDLSGPITSGLPTQNSLFLYKNDDNKLFDERQQQGLRNSAASHWNNAGLSWPWIDRLDPGRVAASADPRLIYVDCQTLLTL